jgi:serine/threonine-protein kinase
MARASTRIGSYELLGDLGQGGMGTVYRARHRELGVTRALKVISRATSDHARVRFAREAETLARLRHPNLVAVHDAGEANGRAYFVMDLIEGDPLERRLGQPLPWREAVELLQGVCSGVGALHTAGVVHRDLKPANVMVTAEGRPVVIDLGLALSPESDERLTQSGSMVGTLCYMAPEQFADVYALGLLAYELLTGEPGVPTDLPLATLTGAILHQDRPAPSTRVGGLPASLDRLVARATARDPARRPADANVLAAELAAIAAAPGPTVGARRTTRRAAAAAGLALSAALGAWAWVHGAAGEPAAAPAAAPSADSSAAEPTQPAAARTPPAPALSEAQVREARRALRKLGRESPSNATLAALAAWLEDFPSHPDVGEARRVHRRCRLAVPLATLKHSAVRHACFVGERTVTVGAGGTVRLWSAEGELLREWRTPSSLSVVAAFTGDPPRIAAGGSGGRIHLLDPELAEPLASVVALPGEEVRALDFTADGRRLAAGGTSPDAVILGVPGLAPELRLGRHGAKLYALAFGPRGQRLYSASGRALASVGESDNALRTWDCSSGALLRRRRNTGIVEAVSWEGDRVAFGTSSGQVFLIDPTRDQDLLALDGQKTERGIPILGGAQIAHHGAVRGVALTPDARRLYSVGNLTGTAHGELRTWDARDGRELTGEDRPGPPRVQPYPLEGIEVSRDGRRLVIWPHGPQATVWQLPAPAGPQ